VGTRHFSCEQPYPSVGSTISYRTYPACMVASSEQDSYAATFKKDYHHTQIRNRSSRRPSRDRWGGTQRERKQRKPRRPAKGRREASTSAGLRRTALTSFRGPRQVASHPGSGLKLSCGYHGLQKAYRLDPGELRPGTASHSRFPPDWPASGSDPSQLYQARGCTNGYSNADSRAAKVGLAGYTRRQKADMRWR